MANLLFNNLNLLLILIITIKLNSNYFKINSNLFYFFLFYHGSLTLLYLLVFSGKAADYYSYLHLVNIRETHDYIGVYSFLSSNFVYQIIIFLKFIFLNDFNIMVIFSLISFFGTVVFIQNLIKLGVDKKIAYMIFLIPGIHFWTGVIGKDCLILFFLAYFFHFYINKNLIYSVIFLIPVFLIRPHIGIIFFSSILLTQIFIEKGHKKFLLISISLIGTYIFFNLPQIQTLLFNSNDILSNNFIHKIFSELNSYGEKYISTSSGYQSSSLYINMLNYVIFPFEFLSKNNSLPLNFFIFIEILTLIFLSVLILKQKKDFKIDKRMIYFLCICVSIYLIIIPQAFFNFGLNARQKWMIYPFIIYLSFLLNNLFVKIKNR